VVPDTGLNKGRRCAVSLARGIRPASQDPFFIWTSEVDGKASALPGGRVAYATCLNSGVLFCKEWQGAVTGWRP